MPIPVPLPMFSFTGSRGSFRGDTNFYGKQVSFASYALIMRHARGMKRCHDFRLLCRESTSTRKWRRSRSCGARKMRPTPRRPSRCPCSARPHQLCVGRCAWKQSASCEQNLYLDTWREICNPLVLFKAWLFLHPVYIIRLDQAWDWVLLYLHYVLRLAQLAHIVYRVP